MSLPIEAIDRLFKRMAATYGAAWDRALGDAPLSDVRDVWAHELAGFAGEKMRCITWALEHLPERCPNVLEFRNLCRQAPAPVVQQLVAPAPNPAKAQSVLASVQAALSAPAAGPKSWARKAVDAALAGQPVGIARLRMACEVLGLRAQEVRRAAAAGGQQLPEQWGT